MHTVTIIMVKSSQKIQNHMVASLIQSKLLLFVWKLMRPANNLVRNIGRSLEKHINVIDIAFCGNSSCGIYLIYKYSIDFFKETQKIDEKLY